MNGEARDTLKPSREACVSIRGSAQDSLKWKKLKGEVLSQQFFLVKVKIKIKKIKKFNKKTI
jgi:hypothetical protein